MLRDTARRGRTGERGRDAGSQKGAAWPEARALRLKRGAARAAVLHDSIVRSTSRPQPYALAAHARGLGRPRTRPLGFLEARTMHMWKGVRARDY